VCSIYTPHSPGVDIGRAMRSKELRPRSATIVSKLNGYVSPYAQPGEHTHCYMYLRVELCVCHMQQGESQLLTYEGQQITAQLSEQKEVVSTVHGFSQLDLSRPFYHTVSSSIVSLICVGCLQSIIRCHEMHIQYVSGG